jgi:hypothetical protein
LNIYLFVCFDFSLLLEAMWQVMRKDHDFEHMKPRSWKSCQAHWLILMPARAVGYACVPGLFLNRFRAFFASQHFLFLLF